MDDGTGANQVDTFGRDEAGRQDVEVVGDIVVDDCVAGIWIERGNRSVSCLRRPRPNLRRGEKSTMKGETYCVHQLRDNTALPAATACP